MLMFFDTEYTYVLAEATKTLSLLDDDVHNSEDDLWRYVPLYNPYPRQRHRIMSVSNTDELRANFWLSKCPTYIPYLGHHDDI